MVILLFFLSFSFCWVKVEIYFSLSQSGSCQFKANTGINYLVPDIFVQEGECIANDDSKIALKDQILLGPEDTEIMNPSIYQYNNENNTISIWHFNSNDTDCSGKLISYENVESGDCSFSGWLYRFTASSWVYIDLKYIKIDGETREEILGYEAEDGKWCVHNAYNSRNDESCSSGESEGNSFQMFYQNNVCKSVRKKTNIYSSKMNYFKTFFVEDYFAYGFYRDGICSEENLAYYYLYYMTEGNCYSGEAIFDLQQFVFDETPDVITNEDYDEGFIEVSIFIGSSICEEAGDCCGGEYEEVKWVQKIISPLNMCVEGAKVLHGEENTILIRKNYDNSNCSGKITTVEKVFNEKGFDECINYEDDLYIQYLLDWHTKRNYNSKNATKEKIYYYNIKVISSLSHLEDNAVLIPVPREKCSKDKIGDDYSHNFRYNYIANPDSCENDFIGAVSENSSFKVDCSYNSDFDDNIVQIKHYKEDYCQIYKMTNISYGEVCYEAQLAGESGIFLDTETDYHLLFWVTCLPKYCFGSFDFDPNVCSGHGVCKSFDYCICEGEYFGDMCELYPDFEEGVNMGLILGITIPLSVLAAFGILFAIIATIIILIVVIRNKKLQKSEEKLKQIKNYDVILEEQAAEENSPGIGRLRINKNLFVIDYKDVKLLSTIGTGGSGATIYLASWNGSNVAFKVFHTTLALNSQTDFDEFEKEVQIQSGISHPNILRFFGCSVKEPRVGIVMEYCSNGDLESYVMGTKDGLNPPLDFKEKLRILIEIGLGMEYLHKNCSIVHRDLKCTNVLLDKSLTSKIIDFGLSKIVNKTTYTGEMTRYVGTENYMAPEILSAKHYSYPADVYAFSIIMYCLYYERFSNFYNVREGCNISRDIVNLDLRPSIDINKVKVEHEWFFDLMKKCWNRIPEERPTFSEIVQIIKTQGSKIQLKGIEKI